MDDKELKAFMQKETDRMDAYIQDQLLRESAKQQQKKLRDEFAAFDVSTLRSMSDKELVLWQAPYPQDSPQYLAATKE